MASAHLKYDGAAGGGTREGGAKSIGAGEAGEDARDGHPVAPIEGLQQALHLQAHPPAAYLPSAHTHMQFSR